MKKIVGTIAAIALAATSAFAEVNVGMGFSCGLFNIFGTDGSKNYMGTGTPWGEATRVGGSISASSENMGVVGDFKFDGGNLQWNENEYIWAKPWDWLKVTIGRGFIDDTLRGNAVLPGFDWIRVKGIDDEDFTFKRLNKQHATGFGLVLTPVEGLFIGAHLPAESNADEAKTVLQKTDVQVGYTIPGIVQLKAQWIGSGVTADDKVDGEINVAVGLKAVEGMTLEVGAFFQTLEKKPIIASAFWSMPIDALTVMAHLKSTIETDDTNKVSLQAGLGASYDLGNGIAVSADVRYDQLIWEDATDEDKKPQLGFGAFLTKGLANGVIGIGVQAAINRGFTWYGAGEDFSLAIPLRVQCSF